MPRPLFCGWWRSGQCQTGCVSTVVGKVNHHAPTTSTTTTEGQQPHTTEETLPDADQGEWGYREQQRVNFDPIATTMRVVSLSPLILQQALKDAVKDDDTVPSQWGFLAADGWQPFLRMCRAQVSVQNKTAAKAESGRLWAKEEARQHSSLAGQIRRILIRSSEATRNWITQPLRSQAISYGDGFSTANPIVALMPFIIGNPALLGYSTLAITAAAAINFIDAEIERRAHERFEQFTFRQRVLEQVETEGPLEKLQRAWEGLRHLHPEASEAARTLSHQRSLVRLA